MKRGGTRSGEGERTFQGGGGDPFMHAFTNGKSAGGLKMVHGGRKRQSNNHNLSEGQVVIGF